MYKDTLLELMNVSMWSNIRREWVQNSQIYTVYVYLQLPMQSESITTNIVRPNPAHGELIQHYGIHFVKDL
jgi:hypothetical protein